MTAITATLVTENNRLKFLPTHFGNAMISAESFAFTFTEKHLEDYDGGLWDYYEVSNGAFFMAPQFDGSRNFTYADNFTDIDVESKTYGIICTLFLLSAICGEAFRQRNFARTDQFAKKTDLLKDYVATLPQSERRKIYSAID